MRQPALTVSVTIVPRACHWLASKELSRARARRNLFAGFLIGRAQMVPWWSWYYYINPVAWSLCAPSTVPATVCLQVLLLRLRGVL